MYKSPVEIYANDPIVRDVAREKDKWVVKSIQSLGINVDKDELIKALKYDRDQYNQGYMAGRMHEREECEMLPDYERAEDLMQIEPDFACSRCHTPFDPDMAKKMNYCPECGAIVKKEKADG